MLLTWIGLGAAFYFSRARELNATPHEEMQYLLLGTKDRPLLFNTGTKGDDDDETKTVTVAELS